MATIWPSSDTWIWPSVGTIGGPCRSTSLAPISCTWTVTSGPVASLGVGWRIWMRASVEGRDGALEFPEPSPPPQPARPASETRTRLARRGARPGRRMRLMPADDTAPSPVLGRIRRSPAFGRGPGRPPAGGGGEGAGRHEEGHDGQGQGRFGRPVAPAAARAAAAGRPGGHGGRRRRRGGARDGGRTGCGGGDIDLDVVGLAVGEGQRDLVGQRARLVGAVDLVAPGLEGVGLHGPSRPRDRAVGAVDRPARRRAGRVPEGHAGRGVKDDLHQVGLLLVGRRQREERRLAGGERLRVDLLVGEGRGRQPAHRGGDDRGGDADGGSDAHGLPPSGQPPAPDPARSLNWNVVVIGGETLVAVTASRCGPAGMVVSPTKWPAEISRMARGGAASTVAVMSVTPAAPRPLGSTKVRWISLAPGVLGSMNSWTL